MIDEYLYALADAHRRRILVSLLETRRHEEILEEVITRRPKDTERVRTELYHVHLPKLDDLGLIDWDREDDVVVRGPEYGDVRPLIETVADVMERERRL